MRTARRNAGITAWDLASGSSWGDGSAKAHRPPYFAPLLIDTTFRRQIRSRERGGLRGNLAGDAHYQKIIAPTDAESRCPADRTLPRWPASARSVAHRLGRSGHHRSIRTRDRAGCIPSPALLDPGVTASGCSTSRRPFPTPVFCASGGLAAAPFLTGQKYSTAPTVCCVVGFHRGLERTSTSRREPSAAVPITCCLWAWFFTMVQTKGHAPTQSGRPARSR